MVHHEAGEAGLRAAVAGGSPSIALAAGIYRLSAPLRIVRSHLRIAAAGNGPVVLSGSSPLVRVALSPAVAALLPAAAHGSVQAFRLPLATARAFADERARTGATTAAPSPVVVTEGGALLHLAGWPNRGYARAASLGGSPATTQVAFSAAPVTPRFTAPPSKAAAWGREPMLRAEGFWTFDWAYEATRVTAVDVASGAVAIAPLLARYPLGQAVRYRILNAFGELDQPGEYAVDPATATLVVWPLSAAAVELAGIDTVLAIEGAADVKVDGIAVQGARGDAVAVRGAQNVNFSNGFVGLAGGNGVAVAASSGVTIDRSVVSDTGRAGVSLNGGDRATLTAANNTVSHSLIRRFGRLVRVNQPGVLLGGVGQRCVDNRILDGPHAGVLFRGNDHRIVGNEIADVTQDAADMGAIYAYGDLAARGTLIDGNFIHDVRRPAPLIDTSERTAPRGVYLDNWISSVTVRGNLILATPMPVFLNSGSANIVARNVFVGADRPAVTVYDLSAAYHQRHFDGLRRTVDDMSLAMRHAYGIAANDPSLADGVPRGNRIGPNLVIGGGRATAFLRSGPTRQPSEDVARAQQVAPQVQLPAQAAPAAPAGIVALAQGRGFLPQFGASNLDLSSLRYSSFQPN